jgi:hypothetical protein
LEEIAFKSTSQGDLVHEAAIKNLIQRSPEIMTKYLEKFAQNLTSPSFTRLLVLLNPHAPISLIEKCHCSTSWLERYAVAKNPHTPIHILDRLLIKDANRVVRAAAKANF